MILGGGGGGMETPLVAITFFGISLIVLKRRIFIYSGAPAS